MPLDPRLSTIFRELSSLASPPPPRNAAGWADQHRILPPGSPEPGPWRSSRIPWFEKIAAEANNPRRRIIALVIASQCGKTEMMLNILGWRLHDDPVPMLYIGPTRKNVESISKDRVMKLLRSVPELWGRLEKGKRNSISEKFVNGVRLGFGWAGSPTETASHPAGLVLVDERSRMQDNREGDPVEQAYARISNFHDGKLIVVSSPTEGEVGESNPSGLSHWEMSEDVSCPTWNLMQQGTRFEWSWPCPACGEYFVPRMRLLKYPEQARQSVIKAEARLQCPHCNHPITDQHKSEMNQRGVFVAPGQRVSAGGVVEGEEPDNMIASFWVSGLASPWVDWGTRAVKLAQARASGEVGTLQSVVNTAFGELYSNVGEAIPPEQMRRLCLNYPAGSLPDIQVHGITAGVDVQKNRLVFVVRAWADGMTSYLLDYGELMGDPALRSTWEMLINTLLGRDYGGYAVNVVAVDSGYVVGTEHLYEIANGNPRVVATKGRQAMDKPFYSNLIEVNLRGSYIKSGVRLWHVNTMYWKTYVTGKYSGYVAGQAGSWNLPSDVSDEYLKQVTAEQLVRERGGGLVWKKTGQNHFFDCEVLAAMAARMQGMHLRPMPLLANKPQRKKKARGGDDWINSTSGSWL